MMKGVNARKPGGDIVEDTSRRIRGSVIAAKDIHWAGLGQKGTQTLRQISLDIVGRNENGNARLCRKRHF